MQFWQPRLEVMEKVHVVKKIKCWKLQEGVLTSINHMLQSKSTRRESSCSPLPTDGLGIHFLHLCSNCDDECNSTDCIRPTQCDARRGRACAIQHIIGNSARTRTGDEKWFMRLNGTPRRAGSRARRGPATTWSSFPRGTVLCVFWLAWTVVGGCPGCRPPRAWKRRQGA
jgi:hypothetical protein